ncbi:DUF4913 domain-containing protein [Pseudarthrobacter sp. S9]|uniref:DUF4913 domain-containing protein n=1 Tax=Pseudarthrobacter sp. S9 TaxID=3418421 RepID=UPI003CFD3735
MSVWWRDHAGHHMRVLLDRQGPFYNCDKSGHGDSEHLEPKKVPAGWFPGVRTARA